MNLVKVGGEIRHKRPSNMYNVDNDRTDKRTDRMVSISDDKTW